MKQFLLILILMTVAMSVNAEVQTREVTYSSGDVELTGYLAWDDAIEGKRPGMLVVHEWWGHNDYPRMRARMLAELGYTALALDMYGTGKIADHPKDAGAFMSAVVQDMETGRARFNAALDLLNSQDTVDEERTGAIGYCFGGGVVLHMARVGADLDVVASFHGSLGLAKVEGAGDISAKVLVFNGAADPWVNEQAKEAFKAEMAAGNADFKFVDMEGAVHGFTNPAATTNGEKFGLPLKYDEAADKASWAEMKATLESVFEQ